MSYYDENDLRNIRMEFDRKAGQLVGMLVEAPEVLTFDEITDAAIELEQMTEDLDDLIAVIAAAEATRR